LSREIMEHYVWTACRMAFLGGPASRLSVRSSRCGKDIRVPKKNVCGSYSLGKLARALAENDMLLKKLLKRSFAPNLDRKGRIIRGVVAGALLLLAVVCSPFSILVGLLFWFSGLFVLFEALRGWCVVRACGIKTKI
jgi:Protein of unknown function (DUF2892)